MPLQSISDNKRFLDYFATLFRGNAVKEPITDIQTGFIHHPQGYPLRWKRVWFADKNKPEDERSNIGFMFQTDKYLKPGATVEIAIPLKNEQEKFRGKVVMVRHRGDHFDIGLWLKHRYFLPLLLFSLLPLPLPLPLLSLFLWPPKTILLKAACEMNMSRNLQLNKLYSDFPQLQKRVINRTLVQNR